jgi:hypothetical protein
MLYYVFDNRDRLEEVIEVSRMTLDDPVIADRIQSGWTYAEVDAPELWGPGSSQLPGMCSIDGDEIVVDSIAQISVTLARQSLEVLEHQELAIASEMAALAWLETHRGSLSSSQIDMRCSGRRQLEVLAERRRHLKSGICEVPEGLARLAGRRLPAGRLLGC